MIVFNFDADLRALVVRELDPSGPIFQSLPLGEQMKRLNPYLVVQQARDKQRLGRYTRGNRALGAMRQAA